MSDFDTIIVGAGSAGCVLAARLSDDPGHRVLVLEPVNHPPARLGPAVAHIVVAAEDTVLGKYVCPGIAVAAAPGAGGMSAPHCKAMG
ncbi:choline dehydrogenase-like flavoprotein [Aminobacter sp. BE322]